MSHRRSSKIHINSSFIQLKPECYTKLEDKQELRREIRKILKDTYGEM
jgi:hypothetical protein